ARLVDGVVGFLVGRLVTPGLFLTNWRLRHPRFRACVLLLLRESDARASNRRSEDNERGQRLPQDSQCFRRSVHFDLVRGWGTATSWLSRVTSRSLLT